MKEDKLKAIIATLLNEAGGSMKDKEIAGLIKKRELWTRPSDGKFPDASQIKLRVNSHKDMFSQKNGLVKIGGPAVDSYDRLCRLTHNEKGWTVPTGHKWSKKNQKRKDLAFENQYGFGGEEWLFNPVFLDDGYHYGYIRGLLDLPLRIEFLPRIFLFSLDQTTSERYFVGVLRNVEIIRKNKWATKIAGQLARKNDALMRNDLKKVGADLNGFVDGQVPFLRFRQSEVEYFGKLIPMNSLKGRQYNRFIPYKVNTKLRALLSGAVPEVGFVLKPGKAESTGKHTRMTTASESTVERLHDDITSDLYTYLKLKEKQKVSISVELTTFGPNIADCVAEGKDGSITILEVKTSGNVRRNMRDAIGQLLDYALWFEKPKVSLIVMISPCVLGGEELALFRRLQKTIGIKMEYWQYIRGNSLAEKFVIYS